MILIYFLVKPLLLGRQFSFWWKFQRALYNSTPKGNVRISDSFWIWEKNVIEQHTTEQPGVASEFQTLSGVLVSTEWEENNMQIHQIKYSRADINFEYIPAWKMLVKKIKYSALTCTPPPPLINVGKMQYSISQNFRLNISSSIRLPLLSYGQN